MPADVRGLFCLDENGEPAGLVTWAENEDGCEIVTIDAFHPDRGHGSRLMQAVEGEIAQTGAELIRIVTTNDNIRALIFFLKRGYRLARVHIDAMDRVRKYKPSVPDLGENDIPLRDMLELEKHITK